MNLILITTFISIRLPIVILTAASVIYIRRSIDREKTSPFECGFDPINSARIPFSTRFFLLAVIFIVFDIEIVLLIPIPLILIITNKTLILLATFTFLIILIIGLLHEWSEGSLNWSS
jgi:NADH-ubiquinone oxidoreductase chain 3